MTAPWPWWLTALALGSITVGYWIAVRRPLGVSGVLARFTRVGEELEFDRGVAAVSQADQGALEAAMLAMTLEAFGEVGPATVRPAPPTARGEEPPPPMEPAVQPAAAGRTCAPVPSLGAHLTFLLMLVAGGALATLLRGGWTPGAGLDQAFARHLASGPAGLAVLASGGALVGFGTAVTVALALGWRLS